MKTSKRQIVAVSIKTIRRAERRIVACQHCERTADTVFAHVLAGAATGQREAECVMSEPAGCPACGNPLLEHHLVEVR